VQRRRDVGASSQLWAERFDKPLADLFDMQDEIVARLAGAMNTELVAAEARRAEQAPTPDSMDLYFQGLAWLNKGPPPDNLARARSFFDRALDADPDNVEAFRPGLGLTFLRPIRTCPWCAASMDRRSAVRALARAEANVRRGDALLLRQKERIAALERVGRNATLFKNPSPAAARLWRQKRS
jgi:hypothetical protein